MTEGGGAHIELIRITVKIDITFADSKEKRPQYGALRHTSSGGSVKM